MSINRRNASSDFLSDVPTVGARFLPRLDAWQGFEGYAPLLAPEVPTAEEPSEEELETVIREDTVETLLGLWDLIVDALDQGWEPDRIEEADQD